MGSEWLLAHVADLLHHAGVTELNAAGPNSNLHRRLLESYISYMAENGYIFMANTFGINNLFLVI